MPNHRFAKYAFVAAMLFLTACAHTYTQGTGLPADVADRFIFHVNVEAQERGMRTATDPEADSLSVYAADGTIRYYPSEGEILVGYVIPNRSGKNDNYYRQKRMKLQELSQVLIDGARKRSRSTQDFAY